jgi:hypothetical protein
MRAWWLRTKDGHEIYRDPSGNCTLENVGSNKGVEFREGEHPEDLKEEWAKKASDALDVECEWKPGLSVEDILRMVRNLSDKHVLKGMPEQYVSDFAKAAVVNVYSPRKIATILQHKFHIPNDRNYTEDSYLQSASESVANYVKGKPVSDFEIDKKVNESNQKDVDVHYRIGSTTVCLEVKCPIQEAQAPFPQNITVVPAGHVPGIRQRIQNFASKLNTQSSINFLEGKNRDLRLKDALVGAHEKFRSSPGLDDLNILFVACGDFYKMSEWHGYLLGQGGLFTPNPFHPPETYRNLDCVILSNLKYRHSVAFDFPAWSLDDVFMVSLQNPHRRKNVFDRTVAEGLSIFKHFGKEFLASRIVRPGAEEIQELVAPQTKVTWFVDRHLNAEEKKRFFPVFPTGGTSPTQFGDTSEPSDTLA